MFRTFTLKRVRIVCFIHPVFYSTRKIISNSLIAVKNAKQAVTRGLNLTLEEGLGLEHRLADLVLASFHPTQL